MENHGSVAAASAARGPSNPEPAAAAVEYESAGRSCCKAARRRRILGPLIALPCFVCLDVVAALILGMHIAPVQRVLLIVRLIALLLGPILAVQFGTGAWTFNCWGWFRRRSARDVAEVQASLALPLTGESSAAAPARSTLTAGAAAVDAELDSRQQAYANSEANRWKKVGVLAVCFFAITAQSIYTATLVLEPGDFSLAEKASILFMILAVNAEFLCVKAVVDNLTEEEGILLPGLHAHPLRFVAERRFMRCDVCRERVGPDTGGYFSFRCWSCDYDVCLLCYRKQQRKENVEEGILRGDKGPKPQPDMTAYAYFRRSLKLMWPFKSLLLMALSCVLVSQAMTVLTPNFRGDIINGLIEKKEDHWQTSLIYFVAFSIAASTFQAIQGLGSSMVQRRIIYDTSVEMFRNLLRQDIVFFDGTMTGQLTSRMTSDLQTVVQPVQAFINGFMASLLRFFGSLVMCLLTSWRLTVLVATLIGPVIYLTRLYAKWSRLLNTRIRANLDDANAIATESFRNIRTVRAFAASAVERAKFRGFIDKALQAGTTDAVAAAGLNIVTQYTNYTALILVLWYGGQSVLRTGDGKGDTGGALGELTVGRLVTYNLYWNMLSNSIQGMTGLLNSLIRAASAAQRVFDIIDLEPDIGLDGGEPLRDEPYAVEFRDVHFFYQMRPGKMVLSGVSFTINPGSTVAFVGKSGAGKSTLVNLILRFYDPQEGVVLLNRKPLPDWSLRQHHQRVGVVTQETQVFCRPIRDNLMYGLSPDRITEEMVISAAQQANAHNFIVEMEMGYKSMVGEGGSRLSGGQRQRLAIARALLRKPLLLLLDEATSALDAESEGLVQEALEAMMKSMSGKSSILLIAHRLSTVISSDKIVVMEAGKAMEQGKHEELLQKDGAYAALVSAQLSAAANIISEEAAAAEVTADGDEKGGKGKRKGKGKGKGKNGASKHEASGDAAPETKEVNGKRNGKSPAEKYELLLQERASASVVSAESRDGGNGASSSDAPPAGSCRACLRYRGRVMALALLIAVDIVASIYLDLDRKQVIYLLLCGLRLALVAIGIIFGVQLGLGHMCASSGEEDDEDEGVALQPVGSDAAAQNGGGGGGGGGSSSSSSGLPLVSASRTNGSTTNGSALHTNGTSAHHSSSLISTATTAVDSKIDSLEASVDAKKKNRWKRNLVLLTCGLLITAQSVYCGAHVVSAVALKPVETISLLAVIFAMNTQFLIVKSIVDKLTEDEGIMVRGVHPHLLTFNPKVGVGFCSVCRERFGPKTGGHKAFVCPTCNSNFKFCVLCYRKQQAKVNTEEGLLRSDKGPRPSVEFSSMDYFKRVLGLIKSLKLLLGVVVVSVLIAQLGNVLLPNYRGQVFDTLIDHNKSGFYRVLEITTAVTVFTALVTVVQGFTAQLMQRSVSFGTRAIMFESLLRQDIALFDGTTTGNLTSRMTNDVTAVVQPVQQILNTVLANMVKLIGGTFMCLHTSWELTVLCATLVGPVMYVTRLYAKFAGKLTLEIRVAMADANSIATESLRNIRIVRAYAADEVEMAEYSRCIAVAAAKALKDAWCNGGVMALNGYLNFGSLVVIMWFGGLAILNQDEHKSSGGFHGGLTIGQLITYNLYWDMMTSGIQDINNQLNMLIRANSAAQRVFEIIDLQPDIQQEVGDKLPVGPLAIAFEDVEFTYQMRPDKKVLKGLSFEIPPGQTIAVVGRSGAGKSTLVSMLLRFYDPQEGRILVNNRALPEWRLVDFVRRVGVVAQDTQVFCRPVMDNLIYGLDDEVVEGSEVIAAAEKANIHSFIMELDQGYRSMVGEGGVRMSGGQKQRLAITRALLRKPSLLLLDEATSALDAVNESLVQEALEAMVQTMAGDCSVMLIAHRLSTVVKSDNIVVMDSGKVVESGKHEVLLGNGDIYAQLVQRQIAAQANTLEE